MSGHPRGGASRPPFRRARLNRLLLRAFGLSTSAGLFALGSSAMAQTIVIPSGNQPAVNQTVTGATGGGGGMDSSGNGTVGGQGGEVSAIDVTLASGANVTSGGSAPSIIVQGTGGLGGTGGTAEESDTGGAGGPGGQVDLLSLTVSAGSSVQSATTAAAAVIVNSLGGMGGNPGGYSGSITGEPGSPGPGGSGAGITVQQLGTVTSSNAWSGSTPGTTAILLQSIGGDGGADDGGNNQSLAERVFDVTGNSGGDGGAGAPITFTLGNGASVSSQGSGVVAISQGGNGSAGANANSLSAAGTGGRGGDAGDGGAVTATLAGASATGDGGQTNTFASLDAVGAASASTGATVQLAVASNDAPAVVANAALPVAALQLQSFGGDGGEGGTGDGLEGHSGSGGAAGNGGAITLTSNNTNISTTGFAAGAVLAQSVGGSGGDGPSAGGAFAKKGGNGGAGGDGGAVNLTFFDLSGSSTESLIRTAGDDSMGIVAQSIGGGGGYGGSVSVGSLLATVSVGGDGESGGSGGYVSVLNGISADPTQPDATEAGNVIATTGARSFGIMAQSIGGGGGSGGTAQSTVIGPFAMAIGGNAGSGGDAGSAGTEQVKIVNYGVVQTEGNQSPGLVAQAVGGGGGAGGSASSLTGSAQINVTVSVGGKGGKGGDAGDVNVYNDGQIITTGADSYGILAQSIGGGGGTGGASKAEGFQLVNSDEAPSLNLTVAVGGSGGEGGDSGNVNALNNDAILTSGAAADGIHVQSIGGGGGNGGDSSTIQPNATGSTFNISVAVGGTGGKGGGVGGTAAAENAGLIWTLGEASNGIFAQSIGGGGGSGGAGSSDTSFFQSASTDFSSSFSIDIGGKGASGGVGGSVNVTNDAGGGILTLGDAARGIFAQSVGGGGGSGGGGIANGTGGTVTVNVGVGGGGGSGNTGGAVTVTNNGAIATYGGDASAIYAQSVGGGGGAGGKGAVGAGTDPEVSMADYLAKSTGLSSQVTEYGNDVYAFKDYLYGDFGVVDKLQGLVSDYAENNTPAPTPGADGEGNFDVTFEVGGGISGKGGAGGDGGTVSVSNTGTIVTNGPKSDGIFAQSVGGGGGDGGIVLAGNNPTTSPTNISGSISIGGRGGSSGDGGTVGVDNTGSITTAGDASMGIHAMSVGAGGGTGGITVNQSGAVRAYSVQLGGDGGSQGSGGAVNVNLNSTNPNASIVTQGDDAVGIVAQSIGGGGGMLSFMTTSAGANGGTTSTTGVGPQPVVIPVVIGGKTGKDSNGGDVTVNTDTITTSGRNAYGVLAQSIGGGGGWVVGAPQTGTSFFSGDEQNGSGGAVNVNVNSAVTTSGAGAIGILAQSIGGGGLLLGDTAAADSGIAGFTQATSSSDNIGDGGPVTISVLPGGKVSTSGANADAIFAQSIGGGGGLVTSNVWSVIGGVGGQGSAQNIEVNVQGGVQASGSNSSAIYIDSVSSSATNTASTSVNVNGGSVVGNASLPAVVVNSNASSNTVALTNGGTISNPSGVAIQAVDSPLTVTTDSTSTISGNLDLPGSALEARGSFTNNGTWSSNGRSYADITNTGTIVLGTNTEDYNNYITGSLTSTGTITTNINFYDFRNVPLGVIGAANIGGQIIVNPTLLAAKPGVLIVSGLLTISPSLVVRDTGNLLFTYPLQSSFLNSEVRVLPTAQLAAVAANNNLSATEQSTAQSLQGGFTSRITESAASTYASLSQISNVAAYKSALDSLSGEAVQAVGTARLASSQAFVERMNSCPVSDQLNAGMRERDCGWVRVIGNWSDRAGSSDNVGYNVKSQMVQLGGQKRIGDGWIVGGSAGFEHSRITADDGMGDVDGNGPTVGAVIKRELGNWLISGGIDAGYGDYDSSRAIVFGSTAETASGSFSAWHAGLHSRISLQLPYQAWYVKPYVDLHATYLSTSGYTESGADALNLNVASSHDVIFTAAPMLEVGGRMRFPGVDELRSFVGVGASINNKNEWSATASLAGFGDGGTFTAKSSVPSTQFKVNAGANLRLSKNTEFKLEYTGQFASGYNSQTGTVRFNHLF